MVRKVRLVLVNDYYSLHDAKKWANTNHRNIIGFCSLSLLFVEQRWKLYGIIISFADHWLFSFCIAGCAGLTRIWWVNWTFKENCLIIWLYVTFAIKYIFKLVCVYSYYTSLTLFFLLLLLLLLFNCNTMGVLIIWLFDGLIVCMVYVD